MSAPKVRSHHVNSGAGVDGLLVPRGRHVLPAGPDVIPVSDDAGEVVAFGPGVQRVGPGTG